MLNSGLCDEVRAGVDRHLAGRVDRLARRASASRPGTAGQSGLAETAREFASLFYAMAVKQMMRTVRDGEQDGPLASGVQDLVAMFLPQAVSRNSQDPVASYISQQLQSRATQDGGILHESA